MSPKSGIFTAAPQYPDTNVSSTRNVLPGKEPLGRQQLALFSLEVSHCMAKGHRTPQSNHDYSASCQRASILCSSPVQCSIRSCPHPTSRQSRVAAPDFQMQSFCLSPCLPNCPENPELHKSAPLPQAGSIFLSIFF